MSHCGDLEALDALLDGELDPLEEDALLTHLEHCERCSEDLDERRAWHESLSVALAARRPRIPLGRLAAVLAIGLSVGIVACAVAFSRPPEAQVARAVERLKDCESRDAALRALEAEIHRDLREARERSPEDAVAVAAWNLEDRRAAPAEAPVPALVRATADPEQAPAARAALRRLEPARLEELLRAPGGDRGFVARLAADLQARARPGVRLSITRTVNGETVTLTQRSDGRVAVSAGGANVEAADMTELQARHPELCERHGIVGADGFVQVGDHAAGADFQGRLDLLFRTGGWDESVLGAAFRKRAPEQIPSAPVDAAAIRRRVESLTRGELERTLERVERDLKSLDERLREAAELRAKARALKDFVEKR